MAGSGTSGRRHGRSSNEDRQQRLIYLGAASILGLVLILIAVGVLLTVILPPRAHVLTVGDRKFNARDVADRAIYLVSSGNGNAQRDPSTEGMESLIGESILFQVGAGLVDEVTDEDVQDAIARRLGLNPRNPEPEATPEATATPDATPEGTAEVTPEATTSTGETPTPEATSEPTAPGYTDEEYATALAAYLRSVEIGRRELENIVRAGLIEDRLEAKFRAELPEAGDQLELWAVPTNDRAAAQRLVDLVRGGASFRGAAVEAGIIENADEGVQELGWFAPTSLNDRVGPFVRDLQAGEVSEIVEDANKVGYEVYFVAERSSDLPYEEAVRDQLARRTFNQWKDEQETQLNAQRDLSNGEDGWIRDRVLDFLRG